MAEALTEAELAEMRAWAENPTASGMVPIQAKNLLRLLDDLKRAQETVERYREMVAVPLMEAGILT